MRKLCFCALLMLGSASMNGQIALTMEKALEIAGVNSPDIKTSLMNLERSKLNLLAQRAALKSRFSLDLYSNWGGNMVAVQCLPQEL